MEFNKQGTRIRVPIDVSGESRTHQSHKASVDINHIVARYQRTGDLPPVTDPGQYVDCTQYSQTLTDLVENAANILETAQDFIDNYQPTPDSSDDGNPQQQSNPGNSQENEES